MNTLSSLLNFIGGKIADHEAVETFSGTRGSSYSNGASYGTYVKATGLVTIIWYAIADTAQASSVTIFTIPSKYRPSEDSKGACIGFGPSTASAGQCVVGSNGVLRQVASNARTQYMGMIQYVVGGVIRSICNVFRPLTLGKGVA